MHADLTSGWHLVPTRNQDVGHPRKNSSLVRRDVLRNTHTDDCRDAWSGAVTDRWRRRDARADLGPTTLSQQVFHCSQRQRANRGRGIYAPRGDEDTAVDDGEIRDVVTDPPLVHD